MKIQDTTTHFFERLADARQRALLLDYDGTLAPFTEERDRAVPTTEVTALLQKIIQDTDTRVVMITGRAAKNLRPLLSVTPVPEIWGTHGLERLRPDGSYYLAPLDARLSKALHTAEYAVAAANLLHCLERKPGALALHLRGLSLPAANHARNLAFRAWQPIAERSGLRLAEFDGGIELREAQYNKGDAVRTILGELAEDSIAAYLGDDLTDEDAFRALREQDLSVLVRPESRDTCAEVWIRPPQGLQEFLGSWLETCCGGVQ